MRVVLDWYYDDLELRCTTEGCRTVICGPYSEEYPNMSCPRNPKHDQRAYFRAFGTEAERSKPVRREQARISGIDY